MDDTAGARSLGAVVVPWNVVVPEADLYIVGYGNRMPNEFTLELLAVLQRCTRVFGVPPIHAPEFKVPAMERLVDDAVSPVDVNELAEVVLAAASDPPVALAIAGSAVVGASGLAHRVATRAAERGLTVHVTNAAPSFDAIWADCNIDPFHGCEIWDAATFVRREIEPGGQPHLLLTEAPTGPEDGAARALLAERLGRSYPSDLELRVIPAGVGTGPHVLATTPAAVALGDFAGWAGVPASTVVVPRVERTSFDFDLPGPAPGSASAVTRGCGRTVEVPWNLVVPEVDVYLVGYGNRLPNDFTLELLAVLHRCTRRFGVPPIHAPDFGIPSVESLMHLYDPGKRRLETYAEWARIVLDAAAADPPVAFATYGSAMVGALAMHRILEQAQHRGLTVHVSNAASSLDGIWADFGIDPCDGVSIWEASVFLRLQIGPDPRADVLLPQAPMLDVKGGIDTVSLRLEASSTVARLRDYLLRFYPPEHPVHFATTASGAGADMLVSHVETLALADLDHPGSHQGSTLLVPRLEHEAQPAAAASTLAREKHR